MAQPEPTPDADAPPDRLTQAVEALVFASDVPLRDEDVARAYGEVTGADVSPEQVARAVAALNAAYQRGGRAFRIERMGGGYRLLTVDEAAPFVRALFAREEERRLSRALLESLAVVAYRQPVSKPEIDHLRGVNSDYALRQLLERGLIALVGRGEGVGRPLLYGTTDAFLDQFGLDALESLPRPREIDELLADPAFARERARLLSSLDAPDAA